MRRFVLVLFLAFVVPQLPAETTVPSVTKINHAWVDGVYWNPNQLPGWGFFVDAQEEFLFGAVYGYQNGNATFIVLQGTVFIADPLEYRGDVFAVSDGGSTATKVGTFTWKVGQYEAAPSARLTISSSILNRSNMLLERFVTVESDKVDMLTAGDWNITTEAIIRFAQYYGISDDRYVDDGITYAEVVDHYNSDLFGLVGYFPPDRGEMFALLMEFDEDTFMFAIFLASDTELFGRYWLLEQDDEPTGNGFYFKGAADTMQASEQHFAMQGSDLSEASLKAAEMSAAFREESRHQQLSLYAVSEMEDTPFFPPNVVRGALEELSKQMRRSNAE